MDAAWEDEGRNVVSVVAWGGMGKSALVWHWLTACGRMVGAARRGSLAGRFYSQGTEERVASADFFVDQALRWLGDPDPVLGSPRDRGLRLAGLVRRERTLLVLDGLEPLQHPPGPLEGPWRSPSRASSWRIVAAMPPSDRPAP